MNEKSSKRTAVLEAAGFIVLKQGVEALTLDAVAKQAQVSKGGLLYHFPTKEALIEGMMQQFIREFDELLALEMNKEADDAPQAGRWLRAYIRLNTLVLGEAGAMMGALVAVSLADPKMQQFTRGAFDAWQARAENDGVPAATATLVRLAADGCWLRVLYGFDDEASAQQQLNRTRENLLALLDNAITTAH